MKTSTTDTPKAAQPKSILIQGPPGGGKTTLMLQFPNLVMLDCDLNLDGPERFLRKERGIQLNYSYEQIPLNDDGTPRAVCDCYDHVILTLAKLKTSTFDWVAVDGLTAINEYIIQKVLKEKRGSEMEARHWQPFKSYALSLLIGALRHLGKNVIVACHENKLTKPGANVMQETVMAYEPFFQGKVGDMLGAFFTDVWSINRESVAPAGSTKFTLTTIKTPLRDLKNSLGLPPAIEDPSYEKLKQFLI